MAGRPEDLFAQLQSAAAVRSLIGEAEDAYLDCKEWPAKDEDAQKMLAKATCGMTNTDGGVLVIGMKAESRPKDEPDVVTATAPVADTSLVNSRFLGLISNLVEPGIVGIRTVEVNDIPGSKSGFVIIYIPKAEGPPRRSRKDQKFYQRIGSATLPMEYSQIEDRFGRRPHARLEVSVIDGELREDRKNGQLMVRPVILTVTNEGSGLARFPALRFQKSSQLKPPSWLGTSQQSLWTISDADTEWFSFRGSANDVLYPGESLRVATVAQMGTRTTASPQGQIPVAHMHEWEFAALTIITEVVCDGSPTRRQSFDLNRTSYPDGLPRA